MAYLLFQLKKVVKNKLTPICLSILILILGFTLFLNLRTAPQFTLQAGAQKEGTYYQTEIAKLKQNLKQQKKNSDLYQETEQDINSNQKIANQDYQIQKAAQAAKWQLAYTLMWQKKQHEKKHLENIADQIDPAQVTETNNKLKFFTYLKDKPLAYESQDMPVTGIQFWLHLNEQYLPYLFTLVALFILTLLLTEPYHQKLDLTRLNPISKWRQTLTEISAGLILLGGSFLLINLLMIIAAAIFAGAGNLAFPYLTYKFVNGRMMTNFVASGNLILPIIALQLLGLLFLIVLVRFLAKIFRAQLPTLLLALLLVLGVNVAVIAVPMLRKVSAWLPVTYLNAVDTVSGKLGMLYQNPQLNFSAGIIVLLGSIVIILVLTVIVEYTYQNSKA
ncbi:hypothetical protein SAMN04487792_1389 [Lactobacillus bombicola]|uniref:Uncharacterized protein n=1 Tax=Lactobacillus bombicola TaxID=1505723 RepID=A0A1I1THU0_9LACO|nr:hypothetical protein [Lactobacillus bombicola]SFD56738.1 hypothetical protein SAMN04487792_1389 [Lactobacillus bombicola]